MNEGYHSSGTVEDMVVIFAGEVVLKLVRGREIPRKVPPLDFGDLG